MSTTPPKPIYLDHAATTPLLPAVRKAMEPYLNEKFGNAGSLHRFGQHAIDSIDGAREQIAKAIGTKFEEIIFTGSATEANNLALRGAVKMAKSVETDIFRNQNSFSPAEKLSFPSPRQLRQKSETKLVGSAGYSSKQSVSTLKFPFRIIISSIEHDSVLQTAKDLEKDGVEIVYLPVDKCGVVDLEVLRKSLNEQTILVSVMYVSNEIGTIQPIAEISKIISKFKTEKLKEQKSFTKKSVSESERARFTAEREERGREASGRVNGWESETPSFRERSGRDRFPIFHTDAVQAFRYMDCDVNKLGVDAITLSAHKIGGPKGVGALYTRVKLPSLITGGGQEFGMRAGTENVAGIVGFGAAVCEAVKHRKENAKKVYLLRSTFAKGLREIVPDVQLNGPDWDEKIDAQFIPHILNVFFPAHLAEELMIRLDREDVAVSSGSACSSRASKLSHVLKAIGCSTDRIQCSLRFSFGPETTMKDVIEALRRIKKTL